MTSLVIRYRLLLLRPEDERLALQAADDTLNRTFEVLQLYILSVVSRGCQDLLVSVARRRYAVGERTNKGSFIDNV